MDWMDKLQPGAFDGLDQHRESLVQYLRHRVADENDVQDLAQEALLRGARYRRSGLEGVRLKGWLIRIARNLQLDRLRGRNTDPLNGPRMEFPDDWAGARPERKWVAWAGDWWPMDESVEHMRAGWKRLPEADRIVLEGYYERGEGSESLAKQLGISTHMVKVRLFRARRRLRAWVELAWRATHSAGGAQKPRINPLLG